MVAAGSVAGTARGADPYADSVVGYTAGSLMNAGYDASSVALGSPERFTGEGVFPSAVTPFNPAFLATEIVAIGAGGSLTLGFDEPIVNDAQNPFGLDLILFGNSFFADRSYPSGIATGTFGPFAAATLSVSANGTEWFTLPGAIGGRFPTLGYSDLTDPYATAPGLVPSDFTKPVSPLFNPIGKTFEQIKAGYAGSGGGVGFDIASSGLSSVSFVRISVSSGELLVDGVSDVSAVPGPSGLVCVLGAAAATLRRRRR